MPISLRSRRNSAFAATLTAVLFGTAMGLVAPSAQAAPVRFGAVLSAANEVPAATGADANASGAADVSVDVATGDVCVTVTLANTSGPLTGAHIHSAAAGTAGPIVVPFTTNTSSNPVNGCFTTSVATAQAIVANPAGYYVNVHTAANPGGAARGQLTPNIYEARLSGANEVGSGDPDGTGSGVVSVDTTSGVVCAFVSADGVALPATGFHVHRGAAGTNGPVVSPFSNPQAAAWASCSAPNTAVAAEIVGNVTGFYLNEHTSEFPGGAIRGQLGARTAALPTPPPVVVVTVAPPTTAAPTTAAPTTAAPTTAAPTTAAPTTAAPTTTVAPPTTASAPPTTVAPAAVAEPATAEESVPSFTG